MSLKTLFKSAVRELRKRNISFAVAGGFAANLYRHAPRLTMEVDFAVLIEEKAADVASSVLHSLGLKAGVVRSADLAGGPMFAIRRKSTKPCMVVGRKPGEPDGEGVDMLLPEIPWAREAVTRAQHNLVDYGFGHVPALTIEDVLLAKLYALQMADLRAKDLDDLQSIFAADPELNLPYLSGRIGRLNIEIPKQAKSFMPKPLLGLARDVARSRKAQQKE